MFLFLLPVSPEKSLGNGQSRGGPGSNHPVQTCYVEARHGVEAATLRSHISLLSQALTLQSHCSSINLQHPAIWSPSSHSDTQPPPTPRRHWPHSHDSHVHEPKHDITRGLSHCTNTSSSVNTRDCYIRKFNAHTDSDPTGGGPRRSKQRDDLGVEMFCRVEHHVSALQRRVCSASE